MKGNDFVTELVMLIIFWSIMPIRQKMSFSISPKESKVKQVKEYSVSELGEVVYTPNMVDKDRSDLIGPSLKN